MGSKGLTHYQFDCKYCGASNFVTMSLGHWNHPMYTRQVSLCLTCFDYFGCGGDDPSINMLMNTFVKCKTHLRYLLTSNYTTYAPPYLNTQGTYNKG